MICLQEQGLLENEITLFEERVSLLMVSIRWYKCCHEVDVEKISKLERNIWLYKIKGVKRTQQVRVVVSLIFTM